MSRNILILLSILIVSACDNPKADNGSQEACAVPLISTIALDGGAFQMGSDKAYAEERPLRSEDVGKFDIDATEVTNAQFAVFIEATSYITDAEKEQPGFGQAGAAVFTMPSATSPNVWSFVEGANWRHPDGPESSIEGKGTEPVVQISFNDARAYAVWAKRRLPTEAEWEFAAASAGGADKGNTWQGAFPIHNSNEDGYFLRAPVGCFPANDNGLYDMIGNVWEWTDTIYQESDGEPIYAIKGGSYLCAPNYCRRYRASARQPQEAGLPTNHIGFRTVSD